MRVFYNTSKVRIRVLIEAVPEGAIKDPLGVSVNVALLDIDRDCGTRQEIIHVLQDTLNAFVTLPITE